MFYFHHMEPLNDPRSGLWPHLQSFGRQRAATHLSISSADVTSAEHEGPRLTSLSGWRHGPPCVKTPDGGAVLRRHSRLNMADLLCQESHQAEL